MDEALVVQELENLAAHLGIDIRYEPFEGDGGLCRLGDRYQVIVNRRLNTLERVRVLGTSLAQFPLDNVFVRPRIREVIDGYR